MTWTQAVFCEYDAPKPVAEFRYKLTEIEEHGGWSHEVVYTDDWREALRVHAINLFYYLDSTIIDQTTGQDVTPPLNDEQRHKQRCEASWPFEESARVAEPPKA